MIEKFSEFDVSIIFKVFTDKRKLENISPASSVVTIMDNDNNLFAEMNK